MLEDFKQAPDQALIYVPPTDIAVQAAAAQCKAVVEARYVMALRRPRNWDLVRQQLLKECRRPSFANNKSSYYIKPIGAGVEGLGIRFVEVAFRCMTNVLIETYAVYEDENKEIMRVIVTDLEANTTYPMDIKITKTVERARPMDDGSYISKRKNSYKKDVYTIPGTDDELLNKRGAMISKAIRTLGVRLIPGDLQDEAKDIILKIRLDKAAKDPRLSTNEIVDGFLKMGVTAASVTDYLGHAIDESTPTEITTLRGLYGAIRDGEATWIEVMDNKEQQEGNSNLSTKDANNAFGNNGKPPNESLPPKKKRKTRGAGTVEQNRVANEPLSVDPGPTAEYQYPTNSDIGLTKIVIMAGLKRANTREELDLAADLINSLPEQDQDPCRNFYSLRVGEMPAI